MGKKSKKYRKKQPRSTIPLITKVVIIYCLVLVSLVLLTVKYNIPLYAEERPTFWLKVIQALYYVVPIVFAFIFSFLFRPFWANLRNILITIFVIYGLYSFAVYYIRYDYLLDQEGLAYKSKTADFIIVDVKHKFLSRDKLGLVNKLGFWVKINAQLLPEGQYGVSGYVSQKGRQMPGGYLGVSKFKVQEGKPKIFTLYFQVNPQKFNEYFERGDFELDLTLNRLFDIDEKGKKILQFSRWSPLLRYTGWDGRDPDIKKKVVALTDYQRSNAFSLLPMNVSRKLVTFEGFVGEQPVDLDGNGLFDQLVIEVAFLSEYEGPIFIQAEIDGASYPLFHETTMTKGRNVIRFAIDARHFQRFGIEGPYEFVEFHLFKTNPLCSGEECYRHIIPAFKIFFDNYITQDYTLDQFEYDPNWVK